MPHKKQSFTLPELLTSISLVILLAALLLPAISNARGNSRNTGCVSQMRQYAAATAMYADAYEDYFPDIRSYLLPESGFTTFMGSSALDERMTRCPGDATTDFLGRLGIFSPQSSSPVRISIGGTSNLTDSKSQTSKGTALIPQARFMPQNRHPDRRCLWTDYQNQQPSKNITGAALDIWKSPRASTTLHQYVFRHPGNRANGAFADGHVSAILLAREICTREGGHDLQVDTPWILPTNTSYPYGPRQISGPNGNGDIDSLKDTPSIHY